MTRWKGSARKGAGMDGLRVRNGERSGPPGGGWAGRLLGCAASVGMPRAVSQPGAVAGGVAVACGDGNRQLPLPGMVTGASVVRIWCQSW